MPLMTLTLYLQGYTLEKWNAVNKEKPDLLDEMYWIKRCEIKPFIYPIYLLHSGFFPPIFPSSLETQ